MEDKKNVKVFRRLIVKTSIAIISVFCVVAVFTVLINTGIIPWGKRTEAVLKKEKGYVYEILEPMTQSLGITDEEIDDAIEKERFGEFMRSKADSIFQNDSEKRGQVYAESVIFELFKANSDDFDDIAVIQKYIDEWAREGILAGEVLDMVRKAMNDKINVVVDHVDVENDEVIIELNECAQLKIGIEEANDALLRKNTKWYSLPIKKSAMYSVRIGVGKANDEEILLFAYNVNGITSYYKADTEGLLGIQLLGVGETMEGEIYNALVNKYRGEKKE